MKVLVIGSGAREHVLCWRLAQSPSVDQVYCAPGNAGIARDAKCVSISAENFEELAAFAKKEGIDLTVVGPEAPLCGGVVNVFRKHGLLIFGPDKKAAQLEGSKDFAKQFMLRHQIPTAKAVTVDNAEAAEAYVRQEFADGARGIVIKADGLAAGKGVLVTEKEQEAVDFAAGCFDGAFGDSGSRVLIEECLYGEEASVFALTDGKTIRAMAPAQDHKRVFDGDKGPNTGGMGAYCPAPVVDDAVMAQVQTQVLDRFLKGIQQDKLDFKGVIFVGLMITEKGPKVLEFNVRFGDPEVQPVLRRLDGDLFRILSLTAQGRLSEASFAWHKQASVSVVIASGGYPGKYVKNHPITGLEEAAAAGTVVFHAGTGLDDQGRIVNTGGRVLGVSAMGDDIPQAIANAYKGVEKIRFQDSFYRHDIGAKALKHLKK